MAFSPDPLSILAGAAAGLGLGFAFARIAYGKYLSDHGRLTEQVQDLLQDKARLDSEKLALQEKTTQHETQHKVDLEQLEKRFSLQFENLANRIFQEKSETFKKESEKDLTTLLGPLKEKLAEFQKKVDDSFGEQTKEQFSLRREIASIVSMNDKMRLQTENLTRALKGDVKAQGNWGEVMLEKILEESGLRKDQEYTLQGTQLGLKHVEDGSLLKPDVIVNLPEKKHIIIDAKVSLTHYERHCSAEDEVVRAAALKDFLGSVRAHVSGLEQRRYQDTEKLGSPDMVLMFMPIEGAFSLALQNDGQLHSYAWDKKIVIVSPTTLFATLKTVHSVWRIEKQNRNTLEIARQGGLLHDKIAGFVKEMQNLGARLESARETYDKAFKNLTSGPGNILKKTQDLQALGVKASKTLPQSQDDIQAQDEAEGVTDDQNGELIPLKTAESA